MIKKAEVTLILVAAVCIGYSSFIHFSFADAKVEFAKLKEVIETLEAKDEYSSLKVNSLVCQNIKVVDDSGTTVVKIGNEDNETYIIVLDENEKPSIELIDGSSLNRITLNESDKSETLITIGDPQGKWIPMFAVGKFIDERNYLEQENIDSIDGPMMILSDNSNDAIFQAYISENIAQFVVGNGSYQSYLQSGTVNSPAYAEIGIIGDGKLLIGMKNEIDDKDNVYHYVHHFDNSYSTKLGQWDDAVGLYTHNWDDDKVDSCFLGYTDTDNDNWSPVVKSAIDGESSYFSVLKSSE